MATYCAVSTKAYKKRSLYTGFFSALFCEHESCLSHPAVVWLVCSRWYLGLNVRFPCFLVCNSKQLSTYIVWSYWLWNLLKYMNCLLEHVNDSDVCLTLTSWVHVLHCKWVSEGRCVEQKMLLYPVCEDNTHKNFTITVSLHRLKIMTYNEQWASLNWWKACSENYVSPSLTFA